jgi:hypothetical protein
MNALRINYPQYKLKEDVETNFNNHLGDFEGGSWECKKYQWHDGCPNFAECSSP